MGKPNKGMGNFNREMEKIRKIRYKLYIKK